jgi:hypothetical protein
LSSNRLRPGCNGHPYSSRLHCSYSVRVQARRRSRPVTSTNNLRLRRWTDLRAAVVEGVRCQFNIMSRSRFISRKYQPIVFAFFMALLMSCLMSFVVTTVNVGLVNNLISIWLKAWGVAFSVAFPIIIIVAPIVRKLSEFVLEGSDEDT